MGSERSRDGRVGPVPETVEQPNPGGDPRDFLRLVSEARAASGEEQQEKVGALIDTLVAMRAPGNERAEAKAVLGQLDLHALTGLVDAKGRSARREAVETVLSLGFPYALAVPPEDLAFARTQEAADARVQEVLPRLEKARASIAVSGALSALIQGTTLGLTGFAQHPDQAMLMALSAGLGVASTGLALARLRTPERDPLPALLALFAGLFAVPSLWVGDPFRGALVLLALSVGLPLWSGLRLFTVSAALPRLPGEEDGKKD